jgi:hypothetical protein
MACAVDVSLSDFMEATNTQMLYRKLVICWAGERLCLFSRRENLGKGGETDDILIWERTDKLN